jgi:cytochrome P450
MNEYQKKNPWARNTRHSPPGPPGEFLLGNVRPFVRDPLGFIAACTRDYGKVVRIPYFFRSLYLLSDPDDIESVLVSNHANFIKPAVLRMPGVRRVMGNGLVTSDGEFWRRQRRLAQPAFHRERVAGYSRVAVQATQQMLQRWRGTDVVDLHREMMKLTLQIVSKTLFNAEVSEEESDIGQALDDCIQLFAMLWTFKGFFMQYFPIPSADRNRLRAAAEKLDRSIYRIIAEHRQNGDAGDLLSLLIAAQDNDGSQMTDQQLRDEAMTLFLAGHETTAIALCWVWLLLMDAPDVEKKLHNELHQVLDERLPTFEDISRLPYTESIVKEAIRLYPPIWSVGRHALNDFAAGGYTIPGGSEVIISQWVNHRNPEYFEQPDRFWPERWTEAFARQLAKFAYFPFSAGPRNCIGSGFAMMEATLILATMAQNISLRRVSTSFVKPFPSITLRPQGDLRVGVMPRVAVGVDTKSTGACPHPETTLSIHI